MELEADGRVDPAAPPDARPREWIWLGAILVVAALARIVAVVRFPNLAHPDEIFQVMEQAHRVVFGYGTVPWEFQEGIRSWILPGLLAVPMWLAGRVSDQPEVLTAAVRLTLAAFSLLLVVAAWVTGRRFSLVHAIVAATVAAVWFTFIHQAGRTLNEVVATVPLVLALTIAGRSSFRRRHLLAIGLLLGACLVLRPHLAPGAAVVLAFVAWRAGWRRCLPMLVGLAVPLLVSGLVDAWTWGTPFSSLVGYVRTNVLEGKASTFGENPIWAYAYFTWEQWRAAGVLLTLLALLGARRLPAWFLAALVIIATHSLIPHKEARFIYPALSLLVIVAAVGSADVLIWVARAAEAARWRRLVLPAALVAWAGTSALLAAGPTAKFEWVNSRAVLLAGTYLHDQPDLCGLGMRGVSWLSTGGYAWLHRPVPVYGSSLTPAQLDVGADAFNFQLVQTGTPDPGAPWERLACFSEPLTEMCVWRRPGGCSPVPDLTPDATGAGATG